MITQGVAVVNSKDKQMPKEVAAAISTIIKFLEQTERDFIDNREKIGHNKEENHENS